MRGRIVLDGPTEILNRARHVHAGGWLGNIESCRHCPVWPTPAAAILDGKALLLGKDPENAIQPGTERSVRGNVGMQVHSNERADVDMPLPTRDAHPLRARSAHERGEHGPLVRRGHKLCFDCQCVIPDIPENFIGFVSIASHCAHVCANAVLQRRYDGPPERLTCARGRMSLYVTNGTVHRLRPEKLSHAVMQLDSGSVKRFHFAEHQ